MANVSITSGKDPDKMVSTSLELLGGLDQFISGKNALIKPPKTATDYTKKAVGVKVKSFSALRPYGFTALQP